MSTTLDPNTIEDRVDGQTIDETWFDILRTHLIDQFNCLTSIITGQNRKMNIYGAPAIIGITTSMDLGVAQWVVEQPFTLDAVDLILGKVFSDTGTLSIEVTRKRGAGAFVTLFTTKPVADLGEGDFERSDSGNGSSVDAQIDTVVEELAVGDIIRVDNAVVPSVAASPNAHNNLRNYMINWGITPGA